MRELANKPGEEAALKSAIQAELAEEHRLMEEVERELEEVSQKLPGGASEGPERAGPGPMVEELKRALRGPGGGR